MMVKRRGLIGMRSQDALFEMSLMFILLIIGAVTLYPFVNVAALSFNDAYDTIKGGIYLWPRKFTFANYLEILSNGNLLVAFRNSVLRTLIGTALGIVVTAMLAYVVSRRDFQARKLFSLILAITMYAGGGLIPTYMLMRNLHLFNTFIVYILPGLVGAWNVFVVRSYIDGLPESIQESARIDGATDVLVFFRIVLPLCVPVLATVSLFIAVGHWNSWFDAYLYNSRNESLTLLQFEMQKLLTKTSVSVTSAADAQNMAQTKVTPESIKMAMTMVATIPILLVYPFLQRYFVSGLTLGAVKS